MFPDVKTAVGAVQKFWSGWCVPVLRFIVRPVLVSCVRSAAEVIVVSLLGLAPLFALVLRASEVGLTPGGLISDALSKGQLFFYAFSLIGTLVWLTIANWRIKNGFVKSLLGLLVVVSIMLTFSFGVFDPTFKSLNSQASVAWSYVLFVLNVLIYFCIMVLVNLEPMNLNDALKSGASALIGSIGGTERRDE